MPLPTEQVGSIPRPGELIDAVRAAAAGELPETDLAALYDSALRDTIKELEATGSPVITDGEQTKPSFATYPLTGLDNLAPDGVEIPFDDGHVRRLPRLTTGPFRYGVHADTYLKQALPIATVPVKQAVIAPSALSLLYPPEPIEDYPREAFLEDLVDEAEADVRRCLDAGAHKVQLDFTEGRLSIKLDPGKALLGQFIELNNRVLDPFSDDERRRIGIHTCPGGDQDSTHSLDVPYAELLPSLLRLKAGNFYIQLASERDRRSVLEGSNSKGVLPGRPPATRRRSPHRARAGDPLHPSSARGGARASLRRGGPQVDAGISEMGERKVFRSARPRIGEDDARLSGDRASAGPASALLLRAAWVCRRRVARRGRGRPVG
jgi:5-methyltetrahydropteroyltriglutamate--homocysteine methyltransferase